MEDTEAAIEEKVINNRNKFIKIQSTAAGQSLQTAVGQSLQNTNRMTSQ